jgi:hypothetical protein
VKKKNSETLDLYRGIIAMQQMKTQYEFRFGLIEIKKKIKDRAEELIEKEKVLREEVAELEVLHRTKNEDGTPKITAENRYLGLMRGQCPAYDARVKQINEEYKALMQEAHEIDIDVKIPKGSLPKDLEGIFQEQIQEWII